MAFYNVCPKCGANLDSDERCGCGETAEKEKKAAEWLLVIVSFSERAVPLKCTLFPSRMP